MTELRQRLLAAQWTRIGGGLTVVSAQDAVDVESLLVGTAREAHGDSRLFWVMASWMAVHAKLIDVRRLGRLLDETADPVGSATLGAGIDIARQLSPSAKSLRAARAHCRPLRRARPLFDIMNSRPVLREVVRRAARPEFLAWGLWQHETSDKTDAIRPIEWIIAHCPELRARGLLGANLEATIFDLLMTTPDTISGLAVRLGATRAATHEAVTNLAGRGLVRKPSSGYRRAVEIPSAIRTWVLAFPA